MKTKTLHVRAADFNTRTALADAVVTCCNKHEEQGWAVRSIVSEGTGAYVILEAPVTQVYTGNLQPGQVTYTAAKAIPPN